MNNINTICIISHQHLSRNPRVLKEARVLDSQGLAVCILTSIYDQKLLQEDLRLLKGTNILYQFYNNLTERNFRSLKNRICTKFGRILNKFGLENVMAFGYGVNAAYECSLALKADLYICHQELPTYVGTKLIKRGLKVAFDFEDWYSQDLLQKDRACRPQKKLENSEKIALQQGIFTYTTSVPMAEELAKYYNVTKPKIVVNSFDFFSNPYLPKTEKNKIRLIWISQTIGSGRGIENLINALNKVKCNCYELNLRGRIDEQYRINLEGMLINPLHNIQFLPLIPNQEIQADLCNYHIGLALEDNFPLNKDLTISNKIFHYLSVGLPTIASSTKGQLSLKASFSEGIYYFSTAEQLYRILEEIKLASLIAQSSFIQQIYQKEYDWQLQKVKIASYISAL